MHGFAHTSARRNDLTVAAASSSAHASFMLKKGSGMATMYRVDGKNADGTVNTSKKGKWVIEYVNRLKSGPKRPRLLINGATETKAESIRDHVETMVDAAYRRDRLPPTTRAWIDSLKGSKFLDRLEKLGLISVARAPMQQERRLNEFIDDYIERFGEGKKKATITRWRQCKTLLLRHFDAGAPLTEITTGHAIQFDHYLRNCHRLRTSSKEPYSESYVRRMCSIAAQFFGHAVDLRLINDNPFATKAIKKSPPSNVGNKEFISLEDAGRILNQFTNPEHRLIFVLMRFGGLRMPSEPSRLRWGDIIWRDGLPKRIRVTSPKTEHHQGKDCRYTPVFPEIRMELLAVKGDRTPARDEFVLQCLQGRSASYFDKHFWKAVDAAGVPRWKKKFNALRSTRANELREKGFRDVLVNEWLGHSEPVSLRHYRSISDADYEDAARFSAQQVQESSGTERIDAPSGRLDGACLPDNSIPCRGLPLFEVGDTGLEPEITSLVTPEGCGEHGIQGRARGAESGALDVVRHWNRLSEEARNEILGIVRKETAIEN